MPFFLHEKRFSLFYLDDFIKISLAPPALTLEVLIRLAVHLKKPGWVIPCRANFK